MKQNKAQISPETQNEAMKIARATQKPGQTKEQTKLIAQGIEKGIAQYKKQQKERARQADKAKKKERKEKQQVADTIEVTTAPEVNETESKSSSMLPWILLAISWVGFVAYVMLKGN
jgi:hypothetical protein